MGQFDYEDNLPVPTVQEQEEKVRRELEKIDAEMPPARKKRMTEILAELLEPEERPPFKEWSAGVKNSEFYPGLAAYFGDMEIKDALAEYVLGQISELELLTGVHIAALVDVDGLMFEHRNFNAAMQV
jgi:hypothetical protein